MSYLKIKDHDNEGGMTRQEGLELLKKKKIIPLIECDKIARNDALRKEYWAFFPMLSGTYIDYTGTDCTITENGKKTKCKIPLENGWYEMNKFGLPFGKPSDSSNPNARYLWRKSSFKGLVVRWGGFFGDGRGVGCCDFNLYRFGVLAEGKPKKCRHKWEITCTHCGMKKR